MASCLAHMDVRQSMRSGDAFETTGAMHRHGQVQSDGMGIAAVRRSIEVTTNNGAIAKMPSQRCNGQPKRVLLIGGWGQGFGGKRAQERTRKLGECIVTGLMNQM